MTVAGQQAKELYAHVLFLRDHGMSLEFVKYKGGYFQDGDTWIGFDCSRNNDLFVEEFNDSKEAFYFAEGMKATTKYGEVIEGESYGD